MPKAGFLIISATPPEKPTDRPWKNAELIKKVIPKLLSVHKHLVITIADGTLQAPNFEAWYPIEGYSKLNSEQALSQALAVGKVIHQDLEQFLQMNSLTEKVTILHWADTKIPAQTIEDLNNEIDPQNINQSLINSINHVVKQRIEFLNNQSLRSRNKPLDDDEKKCIAEKSTLYFKAEIVHLRTVLQNDQPELVWYIGVVKTPHPICHVFEQQPNPNMFRCVDPKINNIDTLILTATEDLKKMYREEAITTNPSLVSFSLLGGYMSTIEQADAVQRKIMQLNHMLVILHMIQPTQEDQKEVESAMLSLSKIDQALTDHIKVLGPAAAQYTKLIKFSDPDGAGHKNDKHTQKPDKQ